MITIIIPNIRKKRIADPRPIVEKVSRSWSNDRRSRGSNVLLYIMYTTLGVRCNVCQRKFQITYTFQSRKYSETCTSGRPSPVKSGAPLLR